MQVPSDSAGQVKLCCSCSNACFRCSRQTVRASLGLHTENTHCHLDSSQSADKCPQLRLNTGNHALCYIQQPGLLCRLQQAPESEDFNALLTAITAKCLHMHSSFPATHVSMHYNMHDKLDWCAGLWKALVH